MKAAVAVVLLFAVSAHAQPVLPVPAPVYQAQLDVFHSRAAAWEAYLLAGVPQGPTDPVGDKFRAMIESTGDLWNGAMERFEDGRPIWNPSRKAMYDQLYFYAKAYLGNKTFAQLQAEVPTFQAVRAKMQSMPWK